VRGVTRTVRGHYCGFPSSIPSFSLLFFVPLMSEFLPLCTLSFDFVPKMPVTVTSHPSSQQPTDPEARTAHLIPSPTQVRSPFLVSMSPLAVRSAVRDVECIRPSWVSSQRNER